MNVSLPFIFYGSLYLTVAVIMMFGELEIPDPASLAACHITGDPIWCDGI